VIRSFICKSGKLKSFQQLSELDLRCEESFLPREVKIGSELQNRYVVSQLLGDGGFGIVWHATDKHEGRDVAIKRMKNLGGGELESLLAEARQIKTLRGHKNIVEMYETFVDEGEGFLVMEYVEGRSLQDIFQSHARARTWLDQEEALDYFKQLLDGLSFAHSHAIFHRDIKPSNILISKVGVVKLVDFGLAKSMVAAAGELGGQTGLGARTGTLAFMSPEVANGMTSDHRTDIFSSGLVGYILLTGRHPFNHPSGAFTVYDLIKESAFDCDPLGNGQIKGLSESACKLLNSMLFKDREQRCQSVQRVLQELTRDAGRVCSQCGASNRGAAAFCDQCGQSLTLPAGRSSPAGSVSAQEFTDDGFALAREENWEAAIEKYRRAIQLDRTYARAYGNLGFALNKVGKHEEAIQICTQGVTYAHSSTDLHRLHDNRGFAKSRLKDFSGAIEDFSAAIKINSSNPKVFHHRAESHALAGSYKLAYEDAGQAIKLDSDFTPAFRLRQRLETQGLV
jgi:tetratricopeptide (TPR) repeat protein